MNFAHDGWNHFKKSDEKQNKNIIQYINQTDNFINHNQYKLGYKDQIIIDKHIYDILNSNPYFRQFYNIEPLYIISKKIK